MNTTITLKELLEKDKSFIIPEYQRGYIWGKSRKASRNSVEYILETLIHHFESGVEVFLQGLTVTEDDSSIVLIDGQQRTTFFYLLFQYLRYKGNFTIRYKIRTESENFLNQDLKNINFDNICESEDEKYQDIYYFKRTLRIIHEKLCKFDKDKFSNFLLKKIKFLYINIPEDKAVEVFTMMNGSKAIMKTEEIIKAELLRLVSSPVVNSAQEEWEENNIRSRYAREWDKWLYWWNKEEVRTFYQIEHNKVMGLLIETYFNSKNSNPKFKFSFENFKHILFSSIKNESVEAKQIFYELRQLQKNFEDVFYSINDNLYLHNKIGAILCVFDSENRKKFINDFFATRIISIANIEDYYNLVFLNLTHTQIIDAIFNKNQNEDDNADPVDINKKALIDILQNDDLYWTSGNKSDNQKILADLLLLRLNVEEDTKLHRPFDFSIWKKGKYSLEHIFPKSKSFRLIDGKYYLENKPDEPIQKKDTIGLLNRADFNNNGSVHCIGNLVLLYGPENSKFGNRSFEEKKKIYFNYDLKTVKTMKSLSLLHTISIFSNSKWEVEEIQKNKANIIERAKEYYGM